MKFSNSHPSSWDFACEPETGTVLAATSSATSAYPPADDYRIPEDRVDDIHVGFGKYRDKTPREILVCDPGWLVWASTNTDRQVGSAALLQEARAVAADLSNNRTKLQGYQPTSNYRPKAARYR